jgi:PPOX class probable F420-dependent enzyme
MPSRSPAEILEFLNHPARTGKLATVRADGRPHVVPIWYLAYGDPEDIKIVFTTFARSVKGENLMRTGQAALSVDQDTPPYAYVIVEGTAETEIDSPELPTWATRIAIKYLGEEGGKAYAARASGPGRMLVRITPTKILAPKSA